MNLLAEDAARVAAAVDLSPLAGKAVLVTGASGLIGVNLIAALLRSEARVIMAATRHGMPDGCSDPRIMPLVLDRPAPDAPPPDVIIHGAGYGQPAKFQAEPLETIKVNVRMTDGLLRALTPGGKFLFLSSSEVYSGSPRQPHVEADIGTTTPEHPRAAYIESKRCGEAVVHAHRAAGVDAKIARVSLVYGPGTKIGDGRVLNQFIGQALTSGRIQLADQGAAIRSYCYVSDAIEMLLNVLLRGRDGVYNVANPTSPVMIRELADEIGALINVPVFGDATSPMFAAPAAVSLNIGRYAAEFGMPAFVPLDAGLARTIAWQKGLYA